MRRFWHIAAMLVLGIFYSLYVASAYKYIAASHLDDYVLTVAGAIGSVFNGCSRILWASLQDKFGFRPVYAVVMSIQLVTCSVIYFTTSSPALYTTLVAASFLVEGSHFSMFPTVTVKLFGIKSGGQIFTFIFFSVPIASTASFLLVNFGQDAFPQWLVFACSALFTIVNMILLYNFDETPIKKFKDAEL